MLISYIKPPISVKLIIISFFITIILLPLISFAANNVRISISDFQVQSDNPQYKYLGKGFAEFVGIDISKAPNVDLIMREKRIEALKEQEISQSGLIDETSQIKIGKMLAANYIVFGSIFDLAGNLSVTFKIMDTGTGKLILQDKVTGKLANYDNLSAVISQKILKSFALIVPDSVNAKAAKTIEKAENAAINFSNAVDAYDKNDMSLAKKDLDKARELDPENEAVKIYLDKLVLNTSKFKNISREYFPNQNPAYLGMTHFDKFFISGAYDGYKEIQSNDSKDDVKEYRENLGYQFPIWKSIGISVEAFALQGKDENSKSNYKAIDEIKLHGGILSLGWLLNDYVSIGAGLSLYQYIKTHEYDGPVKHNNNEVKRFNVGGSLGFLIKNQEGTIIFDVLGGYSNQKNSIFERTTSEVKKENDVPYYNENTLTVGLFDRRMFLVLKEITSYFTYNDYYILRIIPAVEYWFINWISLRAGWEGGYAHQNEDKKGMGWIGGISLRSISLGIDFDINYTYRNKPLKVDSGDCKHESIINFMISKSNLFISR
jgi:TolB-like protein